MLPSRSRTNRLLDLTVPRWTVPAQLLARLRPGLRAATADDVALLGRLPGGSVIPWLVPIVALVLAFVRPTAFAAMRSGEYFNGNPFNVFISQGFLPFTDALALMLVPLVLGLLAPSLGVLFVLTYCLLDLILSIHLPYAALAGRLVEYWLIWLLVVEIALVNRGVLRAMRARLGNEAVGLLVGAGAAACVSGVLVYIWVQATPLLIRPFFTWGRLNGVPTVEAIVVLQTQGNTLVAAGAITALVSCALLRWAGRLGAKEDVVFGLVGERRGPARRGWAGWAFLRPVVLAVLLVAALGGMITTPFDAVLLFAALLAGWWLGMVVRRMSSLSRALGRIPLMLRFVLAFALSYVIALQLTSHAQQLGSALASLNSVFLPVVLATAVSLLLFGILLGGATLEQPRPATSRRGSGPRGQGGSGAALLVLLALAGGVSLTTAPPVLADNCSGLTDCFNSAGAAAAAAAAAAAVAAVVGFLSGDSQRTPLNDEPDLDPGDWYPDDPAPPQVYDPDTFVPPPALRDAWRDPNFDGQRPPVDFPDNTPFEPLPGGTRYDGPNDNPTLDPINTDEPIGQEIPSAGDGIRA